MRLYHPYFYWLLLLFLAAACSAPQVTQKEISISVTVDGKTLQVTAPAGSTVQEALAIAGVVVNPLDRSDPPFFTILTDNISVRITRIVEDFTYSVEEVIPFDTREVPSEVLPKGQKLLSQKGDNGLRRITYRRVYADGVKVSEEEWEAVVVREAVPEIIVVGVGQTFVPTPIPGRLAYLLDGDAWVMDQNTGQQHQVVGSHDLDGRIFSLSPDGEWLLFSRHAETDDEINTLWVAKVDEGATTEVNLTVSNVVHFADWGPDGRSVAYSTVEPRPSAPGWQANNDLQIRTFNPFSQFVSFPNVVIGTHAGGSYGWWGASYVWSPDGQHLALASPDGIGLVSIEQETAASLYEMPAWQSGGEWAWVPGVCWGPDGKILYGVAHVAPDDGESPATSPRFDLVAIPLTGGAPVPLASLVGMFAYPVASPMQTFLSGEQGYQVAYLQADSPLQSENSLYHLMVMDRDGSDRRRVFPAEGERGLKPQRVAWSPAPLNAQGDYGLAVLYQDNLWLVNATTGEAQQLTAGGLTSRLDWK